MKTTVLAIIVVGLIYACSTDNKQTALANNAGKQETQTKPKVEITHNPAVYFEIPVTDLDRATKFYAAVFGFDFTRETIDGNEMALFPFDEKNPGITGALAKGEIYKPAKSGTLVYFNTDNIEATLQKAKQNGGKTLYPKTSIGEAGFVAEFEDSEGNRIALSERKK